MSLVDRIESLSKREKEVLDELLLGSTDRQIAEKLGLDLSVVNATMRKILFKTGQPNRLALVVAVYDRLLNEPKFGKRK